MAQETPRLINTHDQLKAAAASGFDKRQLVAISYHAPDRSNVRDVSVYHWMVWSPFFKTDPGAPWYDNNSKTFSLGINGDSHRERKANALSEAIAWANASYGVGQWAKNRQGDYVPKEVNDSFSLPKRD